MLDKPKQIIKARYEGIQKTFSDYLAAYGGLKEILYSPYFHASLIVSLIGYGHWDRWAELAESIIPSLIGFSLGGYAIWLALGDAKFQKALSTKLENKSHSSFSIVNASFVHFILVQILTISFALIYLSEPIKSLPLDIKLFVVQHIPVSLQIISIARGITNFLGYTLLIYALFTAIAATMAIFSISKALEAFNQRPANKDK